MKSLTFCLSCGIIARTLKTAAVVVFSLCAAHASARTLPIEKTDYDALPVNVKALHMDYDRTGNFVTATGNVEIAQGTRILSADYIKINLTTKGTEARGNVVLKEGDDTLYCNSFNINLDTQLGEVHNARLFIKQQNFHISGEEVTRQGLNKYIMQQGTITTCDGENPVWRIDAGKIDVTVEGYARVYNSTFRLKGFPVLYLPYAIFPVKTKRASGFLFPEVGHSDREGAKFNNSYFWAISDNSDATVWLDLATKKGLGTGLEYRFKLREGSWGKFYGYFANEESRYFDHEYRDERDREKERGYVNFEGEHYFSPDFYAKAMVSYITDREFYGDYAGKVRRSKGEVNKSDIKKREMDESFVFFNKNWEFYNLLANFNFYKNLMHRDPYTLQRAPQMVFSGTKRPLAGTPLFYQLETRYDYLWREEGIRGHRLDVFPKLSLPVNYRGWLKFNPEIGVKGITYLDLRHKDKNYDEEGLFPSIEAELSTTLLRIFDVDKGRIKKLKHAVEPGLLYEYVPENDQSDFPYFDIPDRFYKRHSFGYYLKSRFTALLFDHTGELHEREIGYINVGQVFNISRPKGGIYLQGDPDEDFSDVFAEVRINIFPTTYVKIKASYNPYEHNLRYYNAYVNWSSGRGEFLKLEYRYGRDWFETVDFEGKFKLTNSLYAFFDATYDNLEDKDLDTEFGFDYAAQCWGSIFSIETSRGTGGRSSDTSFNFTFYLKGFGETIY